MYQLTKVGTKTERKAVATAEAKTPTTSWTSAAVVPALPAGDNEYAAIATQKSSIIGNPEGISNEVLFAVDTTSPVVKITSPLAGSATNNTAPTFSGTATGTNASTTVSITIYAGAAPAKGGSLASATATITAGKWTSTAATPALSKGITTYTAVATEESLLGNKAGTEEVTFTVNTEPPTVTLKTPASPSNNSTPTFEGTTSDTTPVTVNIYKGTKVEESTKVSTVTGTPVTGAWTAGPAPALPPGKREYTAVAVQSSSLGNAAGKSTPVTFVVDPEAPTVTLNAPPVLSNDKTPSFTGTASDNTPVTITIYKGKVEHCSGQEGKVSTAVATNTPGAWASGKASPALADGQYTAFAEQGTVVGGHVGCSSPTSFTLDTVPPVVTLTEPGSGSSTSGDSQQVRGTAGKEVHDIPRVTVQLFSGSSVGEGHSPVQSIELNASSGQWSTTFGGLGGGTYTVRAQQRDEAGNTGFSSPSTFTVTRPAAVSSPQQPTSLPVASFAWFPANPRVGESVSLVSSSTDSASAITAFTWDLAGTGAFAPGGPGISTTFSTPGSHLVQLRVTDANGQTSVASNLIPVSPLVLPLMQPFPVVRITSTGTRFGIRLTQLSIFASPGSRITIQCKGRACPVKAQSHIASVGKKRTAFVDFRRFERSLPAGVVLEIRVFKTARRASTRASPFAGEGCRSAMTHVSTVSPAARGVSVIMPEGSVTTIP